MPWMASVGAAAAAADFDGDGDIDLYVTNSRKGTPNKLFQNRGDGTFEEIGARAGVHDANAEHGASMDAVWGDYDNDGHLDLYVVKWGWNVLYHSNGDGTFTNVTESAGVGDPGNGNAAVWLDYDGDANLDLYVGNYFRYVDLWALEDSRQMHESFETARDAGANVLYHNNGDGTFENVAAALGVDDTGWTLDVGCADYDNDGDQDLVLANDFGQDRVFRNNPDGTFTNVTDQAIGWDTNKGMNVDFGDYNNDGWLDLYITNIWTKEYVQEGNQLYRNLGDGSFTDVSFETGVYDAGWAWAGRFWDYDNDGDLDLIVANGYISGNPLDEYFKKLATTVTRPGFDPVDAQSWPVMGDSTFAGYEPTRVWRNEGNEVFTEVARELGLADERDGRGLAIADFDNDGDLDVYVSNQGQDSLLLRNDIGLLGHQGHWLQVELTGTNCNRDAIGTRLTLVAGDLIQIRELDGGNGDHSQCPYRLHFGLGDRDSVDSLEIRWPTGYVERFEGLAVDRIHHFTEDTPQEFLAERRLLKLAQTEARPERRAEDHPVSDNRPDHPVDATAADRTDWNRTLDFKKRYLRFKTEISRAPDDPQLRHDFALLLDQNGRNDAALDELETAIRLDPDRMLFSNTYRLLVRRYRQESFDRSIRFFETLVEAHPDRIMPRLNKAVSYVDKMPYPKLGIVSQGKLSNQSLAELDRILELDPGNWTAKFIRGMNHLHWPRKLGHAALAVQDFEELIALQEHSSPNELPSHFAFAYLALGDSHVKNREAGGPASLALARRAWEAGLALFPDSEELQTRRKILDESVDALIDYVERVRGLADPVDTDLSRVWMDS